jgi:hypothetical protein
MFLGTVFDVCINNVCINNVCINVPKSLSISVETHSGVIVGNITDKQYKRYSLKKSKYHQLRYLRNILNCESIVSVILDEDKVILVEYNIQRQNYYDIVSSPQHSQTDLLHNSEITKDKGLYITLIKTIRYVRHVPPQWNMDIDVFIAVIISTGSVLNIYVQKSCEPILNNMRLMKKALKSYPSLFQFASETIRSNKKIIKNVVANDERMAQHICTKIKYYKPFMLELIELNYQAFTFMSTDLRHNVRFVIKAYEINKLILRSFTRDRRIHFKKIMNSRKWS